MKLRLNTTLRAALIAAITAVGFTLSQARAEVSWNGGGRENAMYYANSGGPWTLVDTDNNAFQITAEPSAANNTVSISSVTTKSGAELKLIGGNYWGGDRSFKDLQIDNIRAGEAGDGTVLINVLQYGTGKPAANTTAWVKSVTGTVSGVNNSGVLTLGSGGNTITVSGTIHSNQGTTLTIAGDVDANGDFTVDSGATFKITAPDLLSVGGNLTLTSGSLVDVSSISYSATPVALCSVTGTATYDGAKVTGVAKGYTGALSISSGKLMLTFAEAVIPVWNGTEGNHAWTDSVWTIGDQVNQPFTSGSDAEFGSAGNATVVLNSPVTAGSVYVSKKAYTFDLQNTGSLTAAELNVEGEGASLALTGAGTVTADTINAAGKTINIGEKVTLQGSASAALDGQGTYALPTGAKAKPADLTLADTWVGTVAVTNAAFTGNELRAVNSMGNANSWVMLKGASGYSPTDTFSANLILENGDNGWAFAQNNGNNNSVLTFTGKIKGTGKLGRFNTTGSNYTYAFSGDISGWSGTYESRSNATNFTIFRVLGDATVVNANVVKESGVLNVEVQTGTSFNAAVTADQMIVNAAGKTATLAGTATLGSVAIDAGTLSLGAENLVLGNVNVADGATLAAADDSSATAIITFNPNSALSVGEDGLVLNSGSTLTFALDGGKVNFSTSATAGSDNIIVATGFASQDDTGVTFDGKGIANAADYFALGTTLSSYTQLKYKDGALLLAREFSASYWGKDKGTGTWDKSSNNWASADGGDATMSFVDGLDAYFTASGAGGTITVGESINVASLNVSGASYTFVNADSLSIAGGINVTESGSAVFDKLAAGELPVIGIGSGSSMTVSDGNVEVQTLTNEGALTVATGDLTIKTAVSKGGNVTADNMILATGENTFASVNVSGGVNGASHLKTGGTSTIGLLGGVNALTLTDGSLSLGGAIGLETTNLNGALTAGAGLSLGAVTMSDGSSIQSTGAVTATGITVNGTANIGGTTTLQTGTVAGGTLKVNSGSTVSIAGGKTTTVSGTLEMLSGSTMDNQGMLSVSGKVIAADGNNLGSVNATGTIEVNGAVSAAGGSIANLDMGAGDSLDVDQNLALTNTTGDAGTLTVDGILTVNGAVALTNVTAGSLVMGATDGKLTATGTLDAGTITLGRVAQSSCYVTAGELATTTTNFVVDEALVKGLGAKAGSTITLADLDTEYAGTQLLVNSAPSFVDMDNFLVYTIMQDSISHDIVLFVDEQESGFVWTGGEDTLWSHGGNWSGGSVPGETDRAQVKNDTNPHEMELDEDAHISHLSVSADDATLRGDHTLLIDDALEVSIGGALTVGDGSSETMVSAPSVQVSGELNVQDNAFVDSRQTSLTGGALSVAPQGAYFTGVMDMTEGASLYVAYGASLAAEQLNGDLDSTVGGRVTVYGNGGRYTGGYDNACIDIVEGADATLYAGEGLTLAGDGTAKLQYGGNAAIAGVDADALTIILNNPSVSNIGSTLTLQQASRLGNGSVQFGMSALDSAKTIGSGAPVILQGDLSLGDGAAVVVNQDSADAGVALDVRNGGSTRNLVLARFGGANTNTRNVTLTGYLYGKYYRNARIENGALLVDLRDDFYRTVSGAHTPNGIAGGRMVDAAFVERNPQATNPNGDLAAVMTALENGAVAGEAADKTLAAMSGASIAAMGAAFGADVDRQLRAIRNRTTTMGLSDCLVNEELPYFNAWVNAEGDYRKLNADGTLAGYKLSSWGGTVGFDVDCTPRFTCGVALTAMHGNFTANSAEAAEGDLDRLYVSAFARYTRRALTQTLVATFGRADAKLHRTVNYGAGAYRTNADTNGTAFGVMYEIGYAKALNEDATTCLQPVLNLSYRHSALDGFNEKGLSDAALTAGDAEMNVFTAAIGARLQSVVGTSVYNRSSLFEGRVMLKLDSGDRDVAVRNHFVGIAGGADAKSAEVGAFGVEIGAGITLPIAEDGGSLFFDVTGEFRSGYSEVNGTVGYRFNF